MILWLGVYFEGDLLSIVVVLGSFGSYRKFRFLLEFFSIVLEFKVLCSFIEGLRRG